MTPDSARFVAEVLAAAPSAEAVQWLRTGFSRWQCGEDLSTALGLSRASQRATAHFWLKHAADLLRAEDPSASDLAIAKTLESRLDLLPIARHRDEVDEALQRALATGASFAVTARRLFEVIRRNDAR